MKLPAMRKQTVEAFASGIRGIKRLLKLLWVVVKHPTLLPKLVKKTPFILKEIGKIIYLLLYSPIYYILILSFDLFLVLTGFIIAVTWGKMIPSIILILTGYASFFTFGAFRVYKKIIDTEAQHKGFPSFVGQSAQLSIIMFNLLVWPLLQFAWIYSSSETVVKTSGGAEIGFGESLYFSVTTFVNSGFGDYTLSPIAKTAAACESVMGYLYLGFLIAIIMNIFHSKKATETQKGAKKDLKRKKKPTPRS